MIIKFIVSTWCNHSCPYCNYSKSTTKRKSKYHTGYRNMLKNLFLKNNSHSFDNYPVELWVNAFKKIKSDFIIEISGGEPFLDVANFSEFLKGTLNIEKCKLIRIDTNGSWRADKYDLSDSTKDKIVLNVSYHPTQTTMDYYLKGIDAIIKASWKIRMINYVMTDQQKGEYDKIRKIFSDRYGIFVNPNPDKFGDNAQQEKELARFFPELDLKYKASRTSPQGKKCYYPSICYFLEPTGEVARGCLGGKKLNFIKESEKLTALKEISVCPKKKCPCIDMYAFLEESGRAKQLDLLNEYVEICKQHQKNENKAENSAL